MPYGRLGPLNPPMIDMAKAADMIVVQSRVVQYRLDYSNSLLYGTSSSNIHKLQRVQDTLPRLMIDQFNISSAERFYNFHLLPIY
jgi:hypothetical protein